METELVKKNASEYRLVYFAPDPDNGERICIALLFDQVKERSFFYDKRFNRVRCLSKRFDQGLLTSYCDSLKTDFRESDQSIDGVLQNYGPQFSLSAPRRFKGPLTPDLVDHLISKFVAQGSFEAEIVMKERRRWRRHFADDLVELVSRISPLKEEHLIRNASASQIVGEQALSIRRVALAVEQRDKVVLIDGVDLNFLWPHEAIRSANEVVHTFWQYKQLGQQRLDRRITRIGVILNGNDSATKKQKDAHDFIVEQFEHEADGVVNGASPSRDAEFARFLAS